MPKRDREHFDEYTIQNAVKHAILTKYLPAYLTALKQHINRFHYIDGFAGRGTYAGMHPGSPLLALDAIEKAQYASRSSISLVENIPTFYNELVAQLYRHPVTANLIYPPLVRMGRFADYVEEIIKHQIYSGGRGVGTFCFVDPCGIEGMRLADLVRFLRLPFGEVLAFFNYAGFNRILGGVVAGTATGNTAIELLGSAARLDNLLSDLRRQSDPMQREVFVRDHFVAAIKADSGAEYFVPFRFETPGAERTSHYLVHCSCDSLAFKIMKSIMWRLGRDEADPYGKLQFIHDSERGTQFSLFREDLLEAKNAIVNHLKQGACKVSEFTDSWVRNPSNPYSPEAYRMLLLELEDSGAIKVYDHSGIQPKPSAKRIRNGKVTLGDKNWVRLRP